MEKAFIGEIKMTDEIDGHAAEETGDKFWLGFWTGAICVPLSVILLFSLWVSTLPVS